MQSFVELFTGSLLKAQTAFKQQGNSKKGSEESTANDTYEASEKVIGIKAQ